MGAVGALGLVTVVVGGVAVQSVDDLQSKTDRMEQAQVELAADRGTVHQDQIKARMLVAQVAAVQGKEATDTYLQKIKDNDAEARRGRAARRRARRREGHADLARVQDRVRRLAAACATPRCCPSRSATTPSPTPACCRRSRSR
ncbi:hypothetical protein GCM10025868_41610 [Angustibacter aerolatus]|uniref:Uncharacterized protein n=1 Tax=Angustibacter aerolatus TaxID=1162965 RepID=A0ABQ6JQF6_9ACTN|nr:hypothetical protein [Angustibacter aerolatus]GMA88911.1 hypothetical protein GCM10025868_41610 [Angustibacter aerolatus]